MALFNSNLVIWILFYLGYVLISPFIFYVWRSAIYQGTANIREAVFKHLQRLPVGYHELHHSGDALSTLTNDVTAAEQAYQQDLLTLVEASVQGVAATIFMLLLDWKLALLIILSGLAPLVINTLFSRPLRKVGQDIQANLGCVERAHDRPAGGVRGDPHLQPGGLDHCPLQLRPTTGCWKARLRRVRLEAALAAGNDFSGMVYLLSYIIAAYLVMIGQSTFGILIGLIQLNNQIQYFVYSLGGVISRVQGALAAI